MQQQLTKFVVHVFRGGDALHPFKYLAEIKGTLEAQRFRSFVDLHIFFFQQPLASVILQMLIYSLKPVSLYLLNSWLK